MRIISSATSTSLLTLSVTVFAQEEAKNKNLRVGSYFTSTTDVYQVAPSRFANGEDDGEEHLELSPNFVKENIVPTDELIMGLYGEEVVKELQEKGIL